VRQSGRGSVSGLASTHAEQIGDHTRFAEGDERGVDTVLESHTVAHQMQAKASALSLGAHRRRGLTSLVTLDSIKEATAARRLFISRAMSALSPFTVAITAGVCATSPWWAVRASRPC
jgi:hypothetical protein